MSLKFKNLKGAVAATMVLIATSISSVGQPVTSDLMEQLKSANKEEVPPIERALQLKWSKSGSTALDLLLRRGEKALDEGDVKAAIEHLTALTDHAPDFAQGWYMRAMAYFQADLLGPAMEDLERALILNPDQFEAIFGFGGLMMALGNVPQAQKAFVDVLRLHPHHENATNALKQLRVQRNELKL